ncbi:MAG: hypothetical protein ACKOJH_13745 [Actinomycetota bacterium]
MRRSVRYVVAGVVALAGCGNDDPSPATDRACPAADLADRAEITRVRAELLLGYVEADAERCAAELGWAYRVGVRDGESFALTEDYSLQRVTVSIEDDVVVAIVVG